MKNLVESTFMIALLLVLFVQTVVKGQVVSSTYGPLYFPNSTNKIVTVLFGGLDTDTSIWMNIDIDGHHWFGIGFADSGNVIGQMEGTDTWIYGNFGDGLPGDVYEYNLGATDIGQRDVVSNLDNLVTSSYTNQYSAHIERLLNDGDRTDHNFVLSGTLCFIWAVGKTFEVSSGHGTISRGQTCTVLPGTTKAPTPSPTWNPTDAPTYTPTSTPTGGPTVQGATPKPSKSPIPSPTRDPTRPTTSSPTRSPTNPPPTMFPTPSPTFKPTDRGSTKDPTSSPTSPTVSPTRETVLAEDTSTNDKVSIWLILILGIAGGVCLVCCICITLWNDRRRRKEREKKFEAKKQNLIEVEEYKAERGLNVSGEGGNEKPSKKNKKDDNDEEEEEEEVASDDYNDGNKNNKDDENKGNYLTVDVKSDNNENGENGVDYKRIKSHSQLVPDDSNLPPETKEDNEQQNNDSNDRYRNRNRRRRNKSRKRNKNKNNKQNEKNQVKSRRDEMRREESDENKNKGDNDEDEVDDNDSYRRRLAELKEQRMQKSQEKNKLQKSKKRGKFGNQDF